MRNGKIDATVTAPSRLILVRHAHADWPAYQGQDFDRPLTPEGLQGARTTAQAILAAGHRPALLLASPACRTRQTAEVLAATLCLPAEGLRYVENLYNATAATLETEVRAAARPGVLIALVGHNPGVSDLARKLTRDPKAAPYKPADWRLLPLPD
jgi:phosphohistidine phosphatase